MSDGRWKMEHGRSIHCSEGPSAGAHDRILRRLQQLLSLTPRFSGVGGRGGGWPNRFSGFFAPQARVTANKTAEAVAAIVASPCHPAEAGC